MADALQTSTGLQNKYKIQPYSAKYRLCFNRNTFSLMKLIAFCKTRWAACLLTCLLMGGILNLTSCQSSRYLWQAAQGQWQLVSERIALTQLIDDPDTPAQIRTRLQYVQQLREFAEKTLKLPVEGAYQHYVDLRRPFVVWNLFVVPELQFENKTWCYPIAGCVSYQGYFNKSAAVEMAARWQNKGYDTWVGGVRAYSTLGWFDDPVLNTFVLYDPLSLAALLFHELAHRKLYVPGDTTFNESWATAVEQEAVEQFLVNADSTANKSRSTMVENASAHWFGNIPAQSAIASYRRRISERQVFARLVSSAVDELSKIYDSDSDDQQKRLKKAARIDQLRQQYQRAAANGKLSPNYGSWFAGPINNAKLSTVTSYHQWVAGLRFKRQQLNNWDEFYRWSEDLAEHSPAAREEALTELNQRALMFRDAD